MLHLPILRWGVPYRSVNQVVTPHFRTREPFVSMSQANLGLIRRDLLKQADANGTRTPVIDEIVRLGEGYSIVTEYTSFIVLENDGEYKRWKIDRKNALRIARDRGQQKAVANRLAKLREQATTEIGPVDPSAKLPAVPGVASRNVQQARANPATAQPQRGGSAPAQRNGQGFDLTPGRGGGAIDPLTAAGMACLVVILWRVGRAKPRPRRA